MNDASNNNASSSGPQDTAKPALHENENPRKLTDWFDEIYVINCQHRPDRLEEFRQEILSKDLGDLSKIHVYPAIVGDFTTHPAGWGAGRGAWGCLQSHRRIMEDLMHKLDDRGQMSWESALILEDDVFFLDNALVDLERVMLQLPPDWGQIYLGGQHRKPPEATPNPYLKVGISVNRTHAYAIRSSYVQAIYRHISYMPDYQGTNKHVDHQLELAHFRKDWPVYCPKTWVCGQRANSSNISGQKLPAMTWI